MGKAERKELISRYEADGNREEWEKARELCQKALADDNEDTDALCDMAYLHQMRGSRELRLAANLFEKAVNTDPENPRPHNQLMLVRSMLLEDNRTVELYKDWIRENPSDISGYERLAKAYLKTGQLEEAEEVIKTGRKLAPENSTLILRQGEVHARRREVKEALKLWENAAELDPENAGLFASIGEQHADLGRLDEALAYWEKARELDPDLISTRYSAVFLLEHAGRLEQAAEEWQQIIDYLHTNGWHNEAKWPERELKRLKKKISGEEDTPY